MVIYHGDLIVGGRFFFAGGSTDPFRANNIARWDGSTWHRLGSGVDGYVRKLVVHDELLVASGYFTSAGGTPVSYIAAWDGTSWRAMGTLNTMANAFVEYKGVLIASGFSEADGQAVPLIARWDGAAWYPFGTQRMDDYTDLIVYRGSLIANVIHRVEGFDRPLVSRWDGTTWVPLGPGRSAYLGAVDAFAVYNGDLIAAGLFRGDDPTRHSSVARWTGSQWDFLGSGVEPGRGESGAVSTLAVFEKSLYVGGYFTTAGNKPSWFIARWSAVITALELEAFDAQWVDVDVHLAWRFAGNNLQDLVVVHLQRSENPLGPFEEVPDAPTLPQFEMRHVDSGLDAGRAYYYRLQLIDHDGRNRFSPVVATVSSPLQHLRLDPIQDPGAGPIAIRYAVGTVPGRVQLAIYSPTGRLVRSLDGGSTAAGERIRFWDRRSDQGVAAARGVYLVHLSAGRLGATEKLVLLGR